MTSHASEPGKTAAKLLKDFLEFDPVTAKPNVLVELPPRAGDGPQIAPPLSSCKHEYTVKVPQSLPPPLDLRPDDSTEYKLALLCKRCRIHVDIQVDYSSSRMPCPTNEHPLHHFRREVAKTAIGSQRIRYTWKCTVEECGATLVITYRLPRLRKEDVDMLTNPERLKMRYEALVEHDASREGIKEATPMQPLMRMRRYVTDAMVGQKEKFPANNKRFQEAFGVGGQECRELLEKVGFRFSQTEEGEEWYLPKSDEVDDRLHADGRSARELLEDVERELLAAMYKMAADQGMHNPCEDQPLPLANMDIERILAVSGYQRHAAGRTGAWASPALPYFSSLGALPDFSDSLVEYAYDRQIECHPIDKAYYLECLQVIMEQRQSPQLEIKVATLLSQNQVSRRDLTAAYRHFDIPLADTQTITDPAILDRFQARQSDLGAEAKEDARTHLWRIGLSRGSQLLINASQQSVETYEDALNWLGHGVTSGTSDDGILSVFHVKKMDGKEAEDIGIKAIATIAKARKSEMLNNFLLTGEQGSSAMSVDEALRHLGIETNLAQVEQSIIPALFELARSERGGDLTEKAIAAVEQALATGNTHSLETWPVGLTSHGNTCYLNSLLQYYFSIKPIRDIVLNYDQYKWDTTVHGEKVARVGYVMVTNVEIEGGQRFAAELKQLFERMIRSRETSVRPEADLVCRAFLKPKDYKLLDTVMPDANHEGGDVTMTNGPEEAIDEKVLDDDIVMSPATTTTNVDGLPSEASSVTMVNDTPEDTNMKDGGMPLTPPASPRMNGVPQPAPEHAPPPLPPRRFSTTKEEALERAQANAKAQQDVTEVHDSITSLLRNGMSPTGKDLESEQEDVLRSLYSIQTEQKTVKDGVEGKSVPQFDSAIQLNVPYDDTDIYSALDAVFDLQPLAEDPALETYRSIKSAGPILQISIPRIGYDRTRSSGAVFKTTACVILEDELYLDRYTARDDIMPQRRKCWGWRKQLQTLKQELKALKTSPVNLDGPNAVLQTAEYLTSLDVVNQDLASIGIDTIEGDGDITAALVSDAKEQVERVEVIQREIRGLHTYLDRQFEDARSIKYRLAAVFFHRGQSGHGHYWIYIHDFANNTWRLYNDERVEKFDKLESIFQAKTWSDGTPTYAVYVAEDHVQEYVDPVCRDPEPAPEVPPAPETTWQEDWPADADTDATQAANPPPIAMKPPLITESSNADWDADRQVANGGW